MKQEDFKRAEALLYDIDKHNDFLYEIDMYGSNEWQESIYSRYAKERKALSDESATHDDLRHAVIMLNMHLLQAERFIVRWLTPQRVEQLREDIETKKQWLQEAFDKL